MIMTKDFDLLLYNTLRRILRVVKRLDYPSDNSILDSFAQRDELKIIRRIRQKGSINVAFFCMSVSLWKYETLFQQMLKDKRFNPIFFISPKLDIYKSMRKEIRMMKDYCKNKNFPYVDLKSDFFYVGHDVSKYDIDVAFYTQPYSRISCREYYYDRMIDSLLCYTPYGYLISKMKHNYMAILDKIAWKNYMPTHVSKEIALSFDPTYKNLYEFGFLGYEMYKNCDAYNWGKKETKRIIWAPHYSVSEGGWIQLSSFLHICDFMVQMARKYENIVSFAFKPHPYLYPSLCKQWGRKKTDEYYKLWDSMPNCILYTGGSYTLMKSSDALIHDCASFLLDYMYTQNPCLYVSLSGHLNVDTGQDGIDAYEAHYHAQNKEEIESFIKKVIVGNNDSLIDKRRKVLKDHIMLPNNQSTAQRIIDDMWDSINTH